MPEMAVFTDTACDLRKEILEEHGIHTVPLIVRFGTEEYLESALSLAEFWTRADQAPPYPGTSQPSVGMFEEAFSQQVERGKHGGTFNSAYTASQKFPGQVSVIDTRLSFKVCWSVLVAG